MQLRPQDLVVLLKLAAHPKRRPTQAELSRELGMSLSEVSQALRRAVAARLAIRETPRATVPIRAALEEFVVHGLRYAFPATLGAVVRGLPTAWAAPPLEHELIGSSPDALPPVWPDPGGSVRGQSVDPLYRSVPKAVREDPALYELLALIDAVRIGRARERESAVRHLRSRLRAAA